MRAPSVHGNHSRPRFISFGLALSCLLCLAGCAPSFTAPAAQSTDLALARFEQKTLVPQHYDRSLGAEAAMVVKIKSRLQPAAQTLCHQQGRPRCYFRISLLDDRSTINAAATGRSQIDVYRGLVRLMPGEAELAFVIAHEMGHHIANHMSKDDWRSDLAQDIGATVFGIAGYLAGADTATLKRTVNDGRQAALDLTSGWFSVQDEYEADYLGVYLLARAGYDPKAAVRAIDHLAVGAGPGQAAWAVMPTHPADDERSARLRRSVLEITAKQRSGADLLPN